MGFDPVVVKVVLMRYFFNASSAVKTGAFLFAICSFMMLTACSPKFDWREVHGDEEPYSILMPAKPSRLSRSIQLGQRQVTMHMTATQIDNARFAAGAIKLPDATQAQLAIAEIKAALLMNMDGKLTHEKTSVITRNGQLIFNVELNAGGRDHAGAGASVELAGRLVAHDRWVFQIVVIGPQQAMDKEAVDTFLDSFTLD